MLYNSYVFINDTIVLLFGSDKFFISKNSLLFVIKFDINKENILLKEFKTKICKFELFFKISFFIKFVKLNFELIFVFLSYYYYYYFLY